MSVLGQIIMFGGNTCPSGFAAADGQVLPIASNSELYLLYGTTYGGDGSTTFALPDLRGRVPINVGTGPGLGTSFNLGDKGRYLQQNNVLAASLLGGSFDGSDNLFHTVDWVYDHTYAFPDTDSVIVMDIDNTQVSERGLRGLKKDTTTAAQGQVRVFGFGKDGSNGAPGKDGADGKDGSDGAPGKDGRDGSDGADGKDGADGADGSDGEDGAPGSDGSDGEDGATGLQGKLLHVSFDYYYLN